MKLVRRQRDESFLVIIKTVPNHTCVFVLLISSNFKYRLWLILVKDPRSYQQLAGTGSIVYCRKYPFPEKVVVQYALSEIPSGMHVEIKFSDAITPAWSHCNMQDRLRARNTVFRASNKLVICCCNGGYASIARVKFSVLCWTVVIPNTLTYSYIFILQDNISTQNKFTPVYIRNEYVCV